MRYRFGTCELDAGRFELTAGGAPVAAEPQVLALLHFLIVNRERLVTRDEIIDAVWGGRIVSDTAISSRIKSARRLIGDDGTAQQFIRTIHGRGFRFVGTVTLVEANAAVHEADESVSAGPNRPSLAVLPFSSIGVAGPRAVIAEALPHEIIRELSRLRWLFVIARGSSFRFAGRAAETRTISAALGARYVVSGAIEALGSRLAVSVELADARDDGVVWAERFEVPSDAVHELRAGIVAQVIAALEIRIPLHEADRARSTAPGSLDAWSAYHLGLRRMFLFTQVDNKAAAHLFAQAIQMEPDFARAHAGLSFTRFQDAFLGYADGARATLDARAAAERAVALDPLDPFANAVMGRAHWLSGGLEDSLAWLDRSTSLSPSYAQGAYAQAWAQTLLCRGEDGQLHADRAMTLSPLDPLRYAMLATRALSHLVRGETVPAADWAERAAREPGAHALIAVIAAACHAEAGDDARAQSWIATARRRQPSVTRQAFFQSFPFADQTVHRSVSAALQSVGF